MHADEPQADDIAWLPDAATRQGSIYQLIDLGFAPKAAKDWVEATAETVEEISAWHDAGFEVAEVQRILAAKGQFEAPRWRTLGPLDGLTVAYAESPISIDEAQERQSNDDHLELGDVLMLAGLAHDPNAVQQWLQRISRGDHA